MNAKEFEQMDALLRVLFNDGGQAWYHVYSKAGVPKNEADWLYETLKADGYVKILHKGADFSIPDPHAVGLTDAGRSWFSKTNYVTEYVDKPSKSEKAQTITITNSKVSGLNVVAGEGNYINPKSSTSFWTNGWTIRILGGIILIAIGYLLKRFLGIGS